MRGVAALVTGSFLIAITVLVMGVVMEPITSIVIASDAVQALGWGSSAESIRDTVLRWSPLAGVLFFVVFAVMWAIRREKRTNQRRRP